MQKQLLRVNLRACHFITIRDPVKNIKKPSTVVVVVVLSTSADSSSIRAQQINL